MTPNENFNLFNENCLVNQKITKIMFFFNQKMQNVKKKQAKLGEKVK